MPITYKINSFVIDGDSVISKNDLNEFNIIKVKISNFMKEEIL